MSISPVTDRVSRGPVWLPFVFAALLLHGALCLLLLIARTSVAMPSTKPDPEVAVFSLVPPPEGSSPVYMASSNPEVMPLEGNDDMPDADYSPDGELEMPAETADAEVSDESLLNFLEKEREALKQELEQMTQLASAEPLPQKTVPTPPPVSGSSGSSRPGPEGAVRELDLGGYPKAVVDEIMQRYQLKVVTRRLEAGRRGQNFLSSASRGSSERYFGGMEVPAGVYEIFQLSRGSVALMSRLEEDALRKKGLEPMKSRVVRIVFGIVEDGKGGYALGVKSLEAEAVEL